jgi:S1-C subfamily serine protease
MDRRAVMDYSKLSIPPHARCIEGPLRQRQRRNRWSRSEHQQRSAGSPSVVASITTRRTEQSPLDKRTLKMLMGSGATIHVHRNILTNEHVIRTTGTIEATLVVWARIRSASVLGPTEHGRNWRGSSICLPVLMNGRTRRG